MIKGIGNDIVELERIDHILKSAAGQRFVQRVLTERELERLSAHPYRRIEFAAGRFAAKEAVAKALGCGIGAKLGFQDIEIIPNVQGKPECLISSIARQQLSLTELDRIHVSITHGRLSAVAVAIWELADMRI